MSKVEKIRAEVERRHNDAKNGVEYNQRRMDVGLDSYKDLITWQHLESAFAQLLSFIDSLPKESISEAQSREQEIIKAADAYIKERGYYTGQLDVAFIEGAEWADEHPIKEPTTCVLDEEANDDCVNIRNSFVRVKDETDIFQGWGRIEKAKK